MTAVTFTMRQLLESGMHFGHHTRRWNPKMEPYIYGVRNNTHIIDLRQSMPLLHRALEAVREVTANGGRVLMVGTKRQASDIIAETAKKTGQYYVNHRWLGGMLTNWKTISNSIKRLKDLEARLAGETMGLTKKELLNLTRERDKLERALGGIKEMGGLPDILFVIDTNKEQLAVQEANKLGLPVVAILDSNSDPDGIQYPVPGNDDAMRAISLYCELVGLAVLTGLQAEMMATGADIGAAEDVPLPPSPEFDAAAQETLAGAPADDAAAATSAAAESSAASPPDAPSELAAVDAPTEQAPVETTAAVEPSVAASQEAPAETPAAGVPDDVPAAASASADQAPAETMAAVEPSAAASQEVPAETPAAGAPDDVPAAASASADQAPAETTAAVEPSAAASQEVPAETPAVETPDDAPATAESTGAPEDRAPAD